MDPRQERTNQELFPIQGTLPRLDDDPFPDVVYHYTDIVGLQGLLETNKIRATDYRYLNDSSELQYTFDLARSVAEAQLDDGALLSDAVKPALSTPAFS